MQTVKQELVERGIEEALINKLIKEIQEQEANKIKEFYSKLTGKIGILEYKICRTCGEKKSTIEFYKDRNRLRPDCKECYNKKRNSKS